LEEWNQTAKGNLLSLPFAIFAPSDGKIVQLKLEVFPKGFDGEGGGSNDTIDVGLSGANILEDIHPELGQFQIETAYRIKHKDCDWPLNMLNSRSLFCFHSSHLKESTFQWLGDCYEIGGVEDRAQDGYLVFELEIRTFSAPRMKFKYTLSKEEFLDNFLDIEPTDGDVKLICDAKEFRCHKFLLTSQSPVFEAMFHMESKEKEQNVVNIVDCAPEVVEQFVLYHYKGVMSSSAKPLELMFGLLNFANKYQVDLLKAECLDVLMDMMNDDNVLKIFAVVNKIDPRSCVNNMVIDFVKKNLKVIVEKEDWFSFLSDYPSLATEFVLNMHEELNERMELEDEDE